MKKLKLKRTPPAEEERQYLQALEDAEIEYYAAQQREEDLQEALAEEAAAKNFNPNWDNELVAARAARNALNDKKTKALTSQKQREEANARVKQARLTKPEPFANNNYHANAWLTVLIERGDKKDSELDGYEHICYYPQLLDLCKRDLTCLVVLSQLLYWFKVEYCMDEPHKNTNWDNNDNVVFYKAAAELALETGLSEDAVKRAYKKLEQLHVLARDKRQIGGAPISLIYLNFYLITEAYKAAAAERQAKIRARKVKIGRKVLTGESLDDAEEKAKAPA